MQNSSENMLSQFAAVVPNFCEKCGNEHDKEDLEVVMSDKGKVVCKLACKNCSHASMIHINSPVDGIVAAKKSTTKSEISGEEMSKFASSRAINSDELIEVYQGLKSVKTIDDFVKIVSG